MNSHGTPSGQWRTRDNRLIPIESMGDSHLLNTIFMLQRQIKKIILKEYFDRLARLAHFGSGLRGEMAQDAFDEDMSRVNPLPWESAAMEYRPYMELMAEADKRSHGAGLIEKDSYADFTRSARKSNRQVAFQAFMADGDNLDINEFSLMGKSGRSYIDDDGYVHEIHEPPVERAYRRAQIALIQGHPQISEEDVEILGTISGRLSPKKAKTVPRGRKRKAVRPMRKRRAPKRRF